MTMWRLSNGESLNKFCKEHNGLYNTALRHIYKGKTVDESAWLAVKNRNKKYCPPKYLYKGEPLLQYCKRVGISYMTCYRQITVKKTSVDNAVKHAHEVKAKKCR